MSPRSKILTFVFTLMGFVAAPVSAPAAFLPPEVLAAALPNFGPANMGEPEFRQILTEIQRAYAPIVSSHGGRLSITGDWNSNTLNAGARQIFGNWQVQITGGLARVPELTPDGFALILCHELGHHLGGFAWARPDSPISGVWAATEGQSDYFATHVCTRKIWGNDSAKNAEARTVSSTEVITACDAVWTRVEEQNLCYRVLNAVQSMTLTMSKLMNKPAPAFSTPDPAVVNDTLTAHPAVQCRMDTSLQGAICPALFNEGLIPGKNASGGAFGVEAEREASNNSCTVYSKYSVGLRPACWYKARLTSPSVSSIFPAGTKAKINVTQLKNANGHVLVSVFDGPTGFPDNPNQAVWIGRVRARSGQTSLTTPELPEGEYAISTIHDENDNQKLDTGAFGIPTEGFGFSNNPAIRTGPPSFSEAKIRLSGPRTDVQINLKHF
jgi:uncharacterized protein (DUF2141 family)